MVSKYRPNFERGVRGNILPVGKDLIINIDGDPMYIIGQLFKRRFFWPTMIQIEQTGTKQNPMKDKITFEMKIRTPEGTRPMPPGKYKVVTFSYLRGIGGKRWKDNFEIEQNA